MTLVTLALIAETSSSVAAVLPSQAMKLVVGQIVTLVSGVYGKSAKVVKITPSEVVVQLLLAEGPITPEGPEPIRFDADGKACDSRDIYKGNSEFNGIPGTFECGPWELTEPIETGCEHTVVDADGRCKCCYCYLGLPPIERFRARTDHRGDHE